MVEPFVCNICMSELLKCVCVLSGRSFYYLCYLIQLLKQVDNIVKVLPIITDYRKVAQPCRLLTSCRPICRHYFKMDDNCKIGVPVCDILTEHICHE